MQFDMPRILSKTITKLAILFSASLINHASIALAPSKDSLISTETKVEVAGAEHSKSSPPIDATLTEAPAKVPIMEQRYHYELAKSALKNKDFETYREHYNRLDTYPLKPYLDYSEIKQSLLTVDLNQVNRFLETNKGAFLETRLREQVLFTLATQEKWREFLKYYSPNLGHVEIECYNVYAKFHLGNAEALDETAKLWTRGKSQPKACDRLFKVWRKHGGLTSDIAWKRFNAALDKREYSLARYVSSLLDDKYLGYAQQMMALNSRPSLITRRRNYSEQSPEMQMVIAHGIRRYARKHPLKALDQWELYEAQQLFPKSISTETKVYLTNRLTSKGHIDEASALVSHSSELQQKSVIERMLREALRSQQYDKVLSYLDHLSEKDKQSDRWLYWRARALDTIAQHVDQEKADKPHIEMKAADAFAQVKSGKHNTESMDIYTKLSKKRSFYGFLSADKLKRAYSLEHKSAEVEPSTLLIVETIPALQRAKELWLKGSHGEAQAEWVFATRAMNSRELIAAGKLARQWGWYNKGIQAMISGHHWDYLDIRFPLAYQETVNDISSQTKVESTLIYAIARQESAFLETAKSSAGAMGLMQLMPGTAKQTARKTGIKHRASDLYDPAHNIYLGTSYLNELLNKFGGNRILAAAAYNAGPHRVKRWIARNPQELPFDVWIETIPFKETRGYVQNVLSFSIIYAHQMGKTKEFITENEAKSLL